MPRTVKCRRVCAEPSSRLFLPEGAPRETITLSVVELEALRLCDLEGMEQDAAARIMNVSRGTLQRILYAARKNTAAALVGGLGIRIEGGNYEVASCRCGCERACRQCKFREPD